MKRKKLSLEEKSFLLACDNFSFRNCGSEKEIEFDHIVPLSRGGADDVSNMQVLCRKCNTRKRDTHDGIFVYDKYKTDELFQSAVFDFLCGDRESADKKMEAFKLRIDDEKNR